MGKQYAALTPEDRAFIAQQHIVFLASCSGKEVNLSPKGLDCIRVEGPNSLIYLDYPGSGNRTATDIQKGGEVTAVFCAFEGPAKILRLFCKGELITPDRADFAALIGLFNEPQAGAVRRLIRLKIYAVETSCGFGVPLYGYQGERAELIDWARKKDANGTLQEYIDSHATPPDLSKL
ncbi:MAG: pyridoxamine 5'-phosphate oxidase family protein [Campylobacterales bacterium]